MASVTKPAGNGRWVFFATLAAAILLIGAWYATAKAPPLSRDGYELLKAIHASCNLQDSRRLAAAKSSLERSTLPSKERDRLSAILQAAEDGRWKAATNDATGLLESQ